MRYQVEGGLTGDEDRVPGVLFFASPGQIVLVDEEPDAKAVVEHEHYGDDEEYVRVGVFQDLPDKQEL